MGRLLLIISVMAIVIIAPLLASGLQRPSEDAQVRLTVVHKNMISPTLQELGQKAGDPSQADTPEPIFVNTRKAQWI
jgi:hypothetical protein